MNAQSGYVLAGFETLATILNNFSNKNSKNRFDIKWRKFKNNRN